jgi:hypothetical protein
MPLNTRNPLSTARGFGNKPCQSDSLLVRIEKKSKNMGEKNPLIILLSKLY